MLAFGVNRQADEDRGRGAPQVLAELGAHAFGKGPQTLAGPQAQG